MKKGVFIILICAILFSLINPPLLESKDYPTKPVTMICWVNPGSSLDVMSRKLASMVSKHLGQSMVVVNKAGGSGAVAMSYVLTQPADGYIIASNTRSMITLIALGEAKVNVDEFDYVIRVQRDPWIIAVPANRPFKTIEELVDFGRKNPDKLKLAAFGTGSIPHVVMAQFAQIAKFKFTWVPFEGGADAVTAAAGGHIDGVIANPAVLRGPVDAKKLIPLGSTTQDRIEGFKDTPTLKEKGFDLIDYHWRGIMVKKGAPADVVQKLHDAFNKVIQEPEWKEFLIKQKQEDGYLSTRDFNKLVEEDLQSYKKILKSLGLSK